MKKSLLCVNFGIIFLIVLCQSFTIICGIGRAQSPFYALPLSINSLSNSLDEDWEKELIELASAWQLTKGKSTLRVGVIDSGVCSTHPDLDSNINTNYDVCYSQDHFSSMYDINGHGTHVSGIIGAEHNNFGATGVCKNISITPYRVSMLSYSDNWYPEAIADSILDAESQGIQILNISGCAYSGISEIQTAVNQFSGLIVCGAGNDSNNNDLYPNDYSPSTFNNDNIISVAASDDQDMPTYFTNYGQTTVDLFAPGIDIYSTWLDDGYEFRDGTSMATPFVTGTIALMKSINPSLSNAQIKNILLSTVDSSQYLSGLCVSGGRLNVYSAVKEAIPTLVLGSNNCVQNLGIQDYQWYSFSVPSGNYVIASSSNLNLCAEVYDDPLGNAIATANPDDSGNFSLIFVNGASGTTKYYIKITNLSSSVSGNYGISISNLHVHYFYYSNTGLRHLVTCSCGYYQLEPHVLVLDNLGIPTCVFCGATPFIGPLESTESNAIETFGNGSVVLDDGTIVLSDTDYCLFASDMTYLSSCLGRAV